MVLSKSLHRLMILPPHAQGSLQKISLLTLTTNLCEILVSKKQLKFYAALSDRRSLSAFSEKFEGQPQEITISLERAVIRVTSVKHEMLPHGIGYLRISQFQNRTGPDLIKAIGKLPISGKFNGLILDLRNNPGGVYLLQSKLPMRSSMRD